MEYQKTNKKYQKKTKRLNTKKSKKMKRVSKVSKKYQKFKGGGGLRGSKKRKSVKSKSGRSAPHFYKFGFGSKINNPEIKKHIEKINELKRTRKIFVGRTKGGKAAKKTLVRSFNRLISIEQNKKKEAVKTAKKKARRNKIDLRADKTAEIAKAAREAAKALAAKVAGTKKAKKTAEKAAEKAKKAKRRQLYEQIKIKGEAGELKSLSKEMQNEYKYYKPVKNTANTHRRVIKGLAPFGGLISAIHYGHTRGNIQKKKTKKEALIGKYEEELKKVEIAEAKNIRTLIHRNQLEFIKDQAINLGQKIVEQAASERIEELKKGEPAAATGGPSRKAETVRRPPMSPQKLEAAQNTIMREVLEGAPAPPRRQSLLESKTRQELNKKLRLAEKSTGTRTKPQRSAGTIKGTDTPRNTELNSLRNKTTKASNVNLRVNSQSLKSAQQEAFSRFEGKSSSGTQYRTKQLRELAKQPKSLIGMYAKEGNKIQQISILLARSKDRDKLLSVLKKQPTKDSVQKIDSLLKKQHKKLFETKKASKKPVVTTPPLGLGN
jgi:histone H1/5